MTKNNLPKFSEIKPDLIIHQLETLIKQNLQTLETLLDSQTSFTWDNLMHPLEEMEDRLHHFWSPIAHLHNVADNPSLRNAFNSAIPLLTEYHTKLGQNERLFSAIEQLAKTQMHQLDTAQKMAMHLALRDFKLAGVALPPEKKLRFAELSNELAQLQTQFEENLLDATEGWIKHITDPQEIAGIPELAQKAAIDAAKKRNLNGWVFTLEAPSYLSIMSHANSSALREEIYMAYVTRASDQGPNAGRWDNSAIMQKIMMARLERAQLLGFKHFTEESLATKMAKTPEEVLDFLDRLLVAVKNKAQSEFATLQKFAKTEGNITELKPWDTAFYSEKLRRKNYDFSQEMLREYFPLDQVLAGLFAITQRLFGLSMKKMEDADVWCPEAACYAVYDQHGQLRSYFYLDLFVRHNKRGGAWMDEYCVRRRRLDGSIQYPVAFINGNFQAPVQNMPSLLTHDEVVTLFHEFGHGLQHMLSTMDYASVSGINGIPWDAVEVASQFYENWTWEKPALDYLTRHYKNAEPLPPAFLTKLMNAKNFQSALQMMRQIELALFDFLLHLRFDSQVTNCIQNILEEVRSQTAFMPTPTFNRFQHSFGHIFGGGYAAGYYSYKWAEVMASDAFSLFKEQGIFNETISQKFMHLFLEKGGSVEPLDLFIQFRGHPPKIEALLQQEGIT
jgi:oligopeptidase A